MDFLNCDIKEKDFSKIATRIMGLGKKNEDGSYAVAVRYTSPLAEVYGIIDAPLVIDERFTEERSLFDHIKNTLDVMNGNIANG